MADSKFDLLDALPYVGAATKGALGLYQLFNKVDRVDTTTPAERENLALARQAAAANLPGLAQYQARLAQIQNATTQSAALGSGSASDLLAAGAAADRTRQQGENQLGTQFEQYRDRATRQLGTTLAAYAAHQQADTDRANQANATLTGAGINNLSNAGNEAATVATYQQLNKATPTATAPAATSPRYPVPFVDGPVGLYRRRAGSMYDF